MRIAESDDFYPGLVVVLNSGWRVIECRHGAQWILQHRNRAETVARHAWRGRSYCRTREALIRCCDEHVSQIDPTARIMLAALPERFPPDLPAMRSEATGTTTNDPQARFQSRLRIQN
jgi:hypothetical protein